MVVADHQLEHFYYGQLLSDNKPQGELRLLAHSSGLKAENFAEVVSSLRVPPVAGHPTLAFAVGRGKTTPFIAVQSQVGEFGQVICHYVLIPADVMRALGGNLKAITSLIEPKMPAYQKAENTLAKLALSNGTQPNSETQQDAMLSLMTATRDRTEVIEAMLAATVNGTPVVIKGAPLDLAQRLKVIDGLLALLPSPARFGVTFSLHVTPATVANSQIKFITDDTPIPPDAVVYQWGATSIEGTAKIQNDYARFIRSQLRLGTELVIEQTDALTTVAAWRIRRGDSLHEALTYASYRLKIDDAINSSLPIEATEVAKVLTEDPTLTDELRLAYVKHLLAFIMATDDVEHADLLVVVQGKQTIEDAILAQLNEMAATGKALRVYKALARWLAHPAGFRGMYWVDLAQRSALTYAQSLVRTRDTKAMNLFLHQVREASNVIDVKGIAPRLLEIALPLAASDPTLAQTALVLAASALSADHWQRFVSLKPILAQLPRSLSRAVGYLNAEGNVTIVPNLLTQAAAEFGSAWRSLMLIRLAEYALNTGRADAFDTTAMAALAQAAATSWGESYDAVLRRIVFYLSEDSMLARMPDDAPRYLLQILLSRHLYGELATELARHNRVLYQGGKQLEYAGMVRDLFRTTPILQGNVAEILKTLSAQGVKPLPLAMAYFGVLEQHEWSAALRETAVEFTTLLTVNRLIVESMPIEPMMGLAKFHAEQRDTANVKLMAELIAPVAAGRGEAGIAIMQTLYRLLDWGSISTAADAKKIGLEAWRRFVRKAPDSAARSVLTQSAALGASVTEALRATYVIRRLLGDENFEDYAYSLQTTANFLQDTGSAYADKARIPLHNTILGDLDSLNGGLSDQERKLIADSLLDLIRITSQLAQQHKDNRSRDNEDVITGLLEGKSNAQSVLEIFRVASGYFGRGRRVIPKLERAADAHPLGDRTAQSLLRELQLITRLLRNGLMTFPGKVDISISAAAIQGEFESLWNDVSLHEQRSLVNDLALDLQRIPELILTITNKVDARNLLENNGLTKKLDANKQRPENTLELYRFVHGYFRGRMRS